MTGIATAVPPGVVVLATAAALAVFGRRAAHALGVLVMATVTAWVWFVPAGAHLPIELFGAAPGEVGFAAELFAVDAVSRLMGLIFGFIGTMAVGYAAASGASARQTAYALSYVGASLGAVFAGDWLTLILFWEVMAVTSTLLVWDYGGEAVRAGFRYALLHGIGGSLLLAAIVWHYAEVGSLAITPAGLAGGIPAALAALGIGVNVGFIGLHAWLPDTYPRPHVAASVFLCVYTTKTGVYGMYRAFPEGHLWIAYMGGAMAVFGAFVALLQNDMRRLLSYHIQSQVGYMVAGVGVGGALATAGAFGHVFNHILYKSLLFMTAGVVIYRTGRENLKRLGGLGREMPLTAGAFAVAALSIAGFPGFNGFVSKGMVLGAAHKEHLDALWYLLLLGGVGTFLSFIKFGYYAFLHGEYDGRVEDANRGQAVVMVTVATLCVGYGLAPEALFAILPFQGGYDYTTFTAGHVIEGLALAAAGVVGFALLKRPLAKVTYAPDVDDAYNPLTFFGTRALVRGVTGTWAAVDRGVVRATRAVRRAGGRPEETAAAFGWRWELRAGIGRSVLFVTLLAAAALLTILFPDLLGRMYRTLAAIVA